MKRLFRAGLPVVLAAVMLGSGGRATAGCARCGGEPILPFFTSPLEGEPGVRYWYGYGPGYGHYLFDTFLPGWGGRGQGWWGWGGFDGRKLIFPPPNKANVFPYYGGYHIYESDPCSCIQVHSNYSQMNWITPPVVSAQMVLEKLREMNIPLVAPEPQFLNKNPRIAEGVRLPVPRPKKEKDTGD
jgi:hypothetical protein